MTMMNTISKRFGAWVTSFSSDPFQTARLKLTAHFTMAIVALLILFNVAVYILFGSSVFDTPEERAADQQLSAEQLRMEEREDEYSQDRLEITLYTADLLTIVVVFFLSYFLAGNTLRPIESMHQKQKKFIADAAHELRTPLTVMKTGMEALLSSKATLVDCHKNVEETLEEVNWMKDMVNDLLWLAQFDTTQPPVFTEVDVCSIVVRQVDFMRPYAEAQGIQLTGSTVGECRIRGNAAHLKRLLGNLIKNAIDYNTPHGTVTVSVQRKGKEVMLTVADTGIGIAPTDQAHVFDRFYKADQARLRQSGGAGLGLSIVQEIVTLHTGRITLESEVGRGSVFRSYFRAWE